MARPAKNWKCQGTLERELRARGFRLIAGADEVGRGSLFGAVVAGAVILSPDSPIRGLNDSKQIEPERREVLADRIRERAVAWAVAAVDAATIDRINIYEASRLAMKMAIHGLRPAADFVLVDAVPLDIALPQQPLIQGDERCHAIAAASILAKVYRDRMMCDWDKFYPEYGLAHHKGYHAPEHMAAIRRLGPTPMHRFSFAPVREHAFHSPLAKQEQMEMFAAV
ncbi:MAG TPA: ribonuclease HII [Bryobacteraceae bacterium]|nr:ribonuclease HII [Bryobacteraceae bacterium]